MSENSLRSGNCTRAVWRDWAITADRAGARPPTPGSYPRELVGALLSVERPDAHQFPGVAHRERAPDDRIENAERSARHADCHRERRQHERRRAGPPHHRAEGELEVREETRHTATCCRESNTEGPDTTRRRPRRSAARGGGAAALPVSSAQYRGSPAARPRSAAGCPPRARGSRPPACRARRRAGPARRARSNSSLGDARRDLGAEAAGQRVLVRDDDAAGLPDGRRCPPSRRDDRAQVETTAR